VDEFLFGCRPFIGVDASSLSVNTLDSWHLLQELMDITSCITLHMQFLTVKMRTIGNGLCSS
jgi:hypothetical protein